MKVYLAGAMSGIEQYNFPMFHRVAKALRENGYEVVNPAELDEAVGFDPSDPDASFDLRAAFKRDTAALLDCDAIALMDGWLASKGARAEAALAYAVGMPMFLTSVTGQLYEIRSFSIDLP